ncbi:MAG: PAC2 family protein [Desulfurococcaceae archaeon]
MPKFVPLVDLDPSQLKDSILITGFQGFGLVGYLTTLHLVRELKLRKIGFIKTRYMPDVTMYTREHGLQYPFEVYFGTAGDHRVIVVVHNGTPLEKERTSYAEYLASLAKQFEVKEVILVGGLTQELRDNPDEKYRWIPINNTSIVLNNAKILEEKYVIGPLALAMMFIQAYGIKGVVILPFTEPYRPDPKAGAAAVEAIAQILGLSISVQKLIEEAAIIEAIEAERAKIEKTIEESEKKTRLTYI